MAAGRVPELPAAPCGALTADMGVAPAGTGRLAQGTDPNDHPGEADTE